MSSKHSKELRSQIKNVVKDTFPEIFTKEAQDEMVKQLAPMITEALDKIRQEVLSAVERSKEATRAAESRILTEAGAQLEDMRITMLAWQGLMFKKLLDSTLIGPEFQKEVEAEKEVIKEALKSKQE